MVDRLPSPRQRALIAALLVGGVLRVLPLLIWSTGRCTRDECAYRALAKDLVAGEGLRPFDGWLWAPGYPVLLSLFQATVGSTAAVKYLQVGVGVLGIWLIDRIATRVDSPRAGLIAAWLLAVHPTLAFFAGTLWSEAVYSTLLLGAVLAALRAREKGAAWALLPGVLVGLCVLFRGVATYMAPIFAVALLWPAAGPMASELRRRLPHAGALLLGVALTVAPWSIYATRTYGGFVVSDATLGQMMWLGDAEHPPISFDYGNGMTLNSVMHKWTAGSRPRCDQTMPPAQWNDCEVAGAKAWIADHPADFARRIPLRVAQLLTPHTFLTRHIRWGKWAGLPIVAEEVLVLWTALTSLLVLWGGTLAAIARARGPYAALAMGTVGYHVAAIALVAGLSRYRVPLEPLWIVFLAVGLARPRATLAALQETPRLAVAALVMPPLLLLTLWFLPAGWPAWL